MRYRIDGVLHDVESAPKKLQAAIVSRIKIMAKLNIAERRLPQDGRIRIRVSDKEIDLRVSTIPVLYGESVVMRILDKERIVIDLTGSGFPKRPSRRSAAHRRNPTASSSSPAPREAARPPPSTAPWTRSIRPTERSSPSRTLSSTSSKASTRSRSSPRSASISPPPCGTSSGRTPISS